MEMQEREVSKNQYMIRYVMKIPNRSRVFHNSLIQLTLIVFGGLKTRNIEAAVKVEATTWQRAPAAWHTSDFLSYPLHYLVQSSQHHN